MNKYESTTKIYEYDAPAQVPVRQVTEYVLADRHTYNEPYYFSVENGGIEEAKRIHQKEWPEAELYVKVK